MRLQALIILKRTIFQIFPDFLVSHTPDFPVTYRSIFLNKHIKQDRYQPKKEQTDKHRLNQNTFNTDASLLSTKVSTLNTDVSQMNTDVSQLDLQADKQVIRLKLHSS